MGDKPKGDKTVEYDGPSGGWGSVRGMARILGAELDSPTVLSTLMRQNKPGGFMCVSCAWTKPADYHPFEFCENGAKATLWELTTRRCTPRILRPSHRVRTQGLEGLRSRAGGPSHPSAPL